jgi:outer membrane receptor protein involved in Fe transport
MALFFFRIFVLLLASLVLRPATAGAEAAGSPSVATPNAVAAQVLSGIVDDTLGRPLANATVTLQSHDRKILLNARTDERGRFTLKEPGPETYELTARKKGFKQAVMVVVLPRSNTRPIEITLASELALTLPMNANRIAAQNGLSQTGTNQYTFTAKDIANLPEGEATPLNQVMLQMPGVALDQNQEIHIRGEHMGIQYQMNGIMLPLDINTDPTFTQLLNARFVNSVSLIDGVLPAQYGYRTSGVIDIHTKDGCDGGEPNDLTILGGQRDTAQASFQLGGCGGKLSYYLTGQFQQSNLGFSSAVPAPDPIHDAVTQGQGFSYLSYALKPDLKLSLITGMTLSFNQFPNQPNQAPQFQLDHVDPTLHPSSAINSGLNQQDYYGVLALTGTAGPGADYQLAYSAHYNTQTFYPDRVGDLIYQGVASNVFTSDLSNSLQGDLTYRWGSSHILRGGFYLGEYGVESDQTSQVFPIVAGVPSVVPISLAANLNKINLVYGVYVQDHWQITDQVSVNVGSRWDRVTGFTVDSQFSPTINFVYQPRIDTTLHGGFVRNFQVPNFQNVSSGIFQLFAGTTGAVGTANGRTSPFAETDYTWDAGFVHQFTPRLTFTQDNYLRIDRHYLDEGQFGFVPIDAPFNYVRGYGGGTENTFTYNLEKLAFRANLFVAREEDIGVASGQYNFPAAENASIDRHYIVLDHTPLVGASGGVAYSWNDYHFTFDGLFSSGLRAGFANQTQLPKVWQFNLSGAKDFVIAGFGKFTNRVVLLNIFDRTNLIRPANGIGVFQAAYGPRITVYDALTIPLPSL